MLAFLAGTSAVATSLVFLGGALYGTSASLGLILTVVGGGWLGLLHAGLVVAAQRRPGDSP